MTRDILRLLLLIFISSQTFSQTKQDYNLKLEYVMHLNMNGIKQYQTTLFSNKDQSFFKFKIKNQLDQRLTRDNDDDSKYSFIISDTTEYFIKSNKVENTIYQLEKEIKTKKLILVKESIPQINWNITNNTKLINNHKCYQAFGFFAGRNYTVWFSPDIPTFFGPWKLHGLPGAILEATDDLNEVKLVCVKIENQKFPFIKMKLKNIKLTTRVQYIESLNTFFKELESRLNSKISRGYSLSISKPKFFAIEKYND